MTIGGNYGWRCFERAVGRRLQQLRAHWCTGPLGMFRIGTKLEVTREISLDFGLSHTSFINTNKDRGEESMYLSLTWKPFK